MAGNNLRDYLFRKANEQKVPLGGAFEISPVCNFHCHMCFVRRTREGLLAEGREEIPAEQWLSLASECHEKGMLYLLLTGGEPFFYPGFRELYEGLHDMGLLLSINTNGSLITEETIEWLKKRAPERINLTLYGMSEESYDSLCGSRNAFRHVIRVIESLHEAGIHLVLNASMTPENKEDLTKIFSYANSMGIHANVATYMFPPLRRCREESDSRLSAAEAGRLQVQALACRINEEKIASAAASVLDKLARGRVCAEECRKQGGVLPEKIRCRAGRSSFWVSWEGRMTACAMMDAPLVLNPFRDGFGPCWEALVQATEAMQVLNKCAGCELREICKPCAAMIFAETGAMDGCAPYLREMAESVCESWKSHMDERSMQ